MRTSRALFTAVVIVGAQGTARSEPVLDASASATWEENITHCPDPVATKDAMLYDATFAARWRNQDSRDVSLHFDLNAGAEACPDFNGLDRVLGGAQVALQRKFGLGPLAPVIRADISYTVSAYREEDRNGTRFQASLAWSKRWNESWQTVLTGEYLANDGHAQAYDYSNHGVSFEVRYDLTDRWQLTAGGKRQWGDQVTYAWLGGSGADFPYAYEHWQNTTESPTFGENWYVYTLDATADTFWFSLSPALNANRSLPLRYEQTSVVGPGESYKVRMITLSFVQRF